MSAKPRRASAAGSSRWSAARRLGNTAFDYVPQTTSAVTYAPNGLNQYASITPAGGSATSIGYDLNGNLTSDGTFAFGYDPENRLMTANKTGQSVAYSYDPLGHRTTKAVTGGSYAGTTYFLDSGDDEIAEYDGSGNVLRRFVPGPGIDRPIAMIGCAGTNCSTATKTFFHQDKTGSVIAMSDTSGAITEGPYTYDPFGNGAPVSGVPYKYTGRRLDPETGLNYYRARYYSAPLGRFLQTDPVGYKDDINWYTYVGNDPTDKTDPTGMKARVMIDPSTRTIRVIVPITPINGPSQSQVERSVASISQDVRDPQGNAWHVKFETTSGSLTDSRTGVSYTNSSVHEGNFDEPAGRQSERGQALNFRGATGVRAEVGADATDKTVAHEVGGHGAGLRDAYNPATLQPDPSRPGNLMNNTDGTRLDWGQVQEMTSQQSGNEILPNQRERTWGQWFHDHFF